MAAQTGSGPAVLITGGTSALAWPQPAHGKSVEWPVAREITRYTHRLRILHLGSWLTSKEKTNVYC
jgi:hypothetical protein